MAKKNSVMNNHRIKALTVSIARWKLAAELTGTKATFKISDWVRYWLNQAAEGKFLPELTERRFPRGQVQELTGNFQFRASVEELDAWQAAADKSPCLNLAKRGSRPERAEWERQVLDAAANQCLGRKVA